jgi:hypothetical protein
MKHVLRTLTFTPAVLALLAGCAGGAASLPPASSTPVAPPPVAAPLQMQQLNETGTEVLTASQVTINSAQCQINCSASFKVQGTASGLLTGTFTAQGSWSYLGLGPNPALTFSESFTVRAVNMPITGSISNQGVQHIQGVATNPAEGRTVRYSFGPDAAFGPVAYDYRLGNLTTKDGAFIDIIEGGAFREVLSGFTE